MGEVVTVPGLTEDELREIAIEAALDELDDGEELLPLQPGEFTQEQWRLAYNERYGVEITSTTARRKLDKLVARGKIASQERKAPGPGVRVIGYRHVKGEDN